MRRHTRWAGALGLALTSFLFACGGSDSDPVTSTPPLVEPPVVVTTTDEPIPQATGHGLASLPEPVGPFFYITSYGAVSNGSAVTNQTAINNAIDAASAAGGGTVVIPAGTFKSYTIRLKSNVGIHLATAASVIRSAVHGTNTASGQDGGFYDAPEGNPFVGLQDHGHSHWANSLIYGNGVENVMISGPGLIDGSYLNTATLTVNVLSGNDPGEVSNRGNAGTAAGANKAIALKNAKNIVMRDFSMKNGGHFAIIGTGVIGWTMDGLIIDTNRDALDVDQSQNVTIRNSVFNSLTDDAVVIKASFGIGRYLKTRNVLVEDCIVSGYDAGSVLDGTYSSEKLVATDQDGPTARFKLGTEATTGFELITVKRMTFERSRGFALESVDGAELKDIVFADSKMTNVSSSPIFIRLGDRGRAPVTGISSSEAVSAANNVRLDDTGWVMPNLTAIYGNYPATRWIPSYTKNASVAIGGGVGFNIVSPTAPTRLNPNSVNPADPLFANALAIPLARVRNIEISNIEIKDVDPRYPILIAGLVGRPIENVRISNVSVEYRGGLAMEHAVEQRQLNQTWNYTGYQAANANQTIPWLSNTFFAKNEALLPRIRWDAAANSGAGGWADDPYNIPEMPREYPEPSLFGILPAYGLYARHVTGLSVNNVTFKYKVEDGRPAVVLDDVTNAKFAAFSADIKPGVPHVVKVTNTMKRDPVREYVKDLPYKKTQVTGLTVPGNLVVQEVTVDRPAPGTPPDTLYALPTAPNATYTYSYTVANAAYPKPLTVYRPQFVAMGGKSVAAGTPLTFVANAKSPATGVTLTYSAESLPAGATYDTSTQTFSWTPAAGQVGKHKMKFVVNDGVYPESREVTITVTP